MKLIFYLARNFHLEEVQTPVGMYNSSHIDVEDESNAPEDDLLPLSVTAMDVCRETNVVGNLNPTEDDRQSMAPEDDILPPSVAAMDICQETNSAGKLNPTEDDRQSRTTLADDANTFSQHVPGIDVSLISVDNLPPPV
jgi:hypothetical protein